MRSAHYTMTAKDIYRFAAAMLQPQLKWHDYGPKCTVLVLLQVLFFAAAQLLRPALAYEPPQVIRRYAMH